MVVTTLTGTLGLNTARVAEVPSQAALEHHNNHLVLSSYLVPEFPDGSVQGGPRNQMLAGEPFHPDIFKHYRENQCLLNLCRWVT